MAVLNVAAIAPDGPGYLTVFPCGPDRPGSSTLNFAAGEVVANGATIRLAANGTVCVFTNQAMHLIVDVTGYVPAWLAAVSRRSASGHVVSSGSDDPNCAGDVDRVALGR
jgi:hypothetical protein